MVDEVYGDLLIAESKKNGKPMIAVLYATGCSVCESAVELFAELKEIYSDRVRFFVMEIERGDGVQLFEDTCRQLGVDGHPVVVSFKGGEKVVSKICWGTPEEQYDDMRKLVKGLVG